MLTRREVFEFIAALARQEETYGAYRHVEATSNVYTEGAHYQNKDELLEDIARLAEWASNADWDKYR